MVSKQRIVEPWGARHVMSTRNVEMREEGEAKVRRARGSRRRCGGYNPVASANRSIQNRLTEDA